MIYDAIIAGGGPAGLNAALILGRCRRRVLVCDSGKPRNAASKGMHGFLSRDGVLPSELLRLGREELVPYGVAFRNQAVADAQREGSIFVATLEDGARFCARKLLLATGVRDRIPGIDGIERFYGTSVFHCPYCDGWEVREQRLAVYGKGTHGYHLALSLMTWSDDVMLFTDGPGHLKPEWRQELRFFGVPVREERIRRLEGTGPVLERIVLTNGERVERRAMFFSTGQDQHCDLPARLGCTFNRAGTVDTNRFQATNVPGLYVAGDAAKDVQFVIVAAAEGAKAGLAINEALQDEERRARRERAGLRLSGE